MANEPPRVLEGRCAGILGVFYVFLMKMAWRFAQDRKARVGTMES